MTAGARTVGVLGTMVWDRIEQPGSPIVEGWGGISYSLAAAAAALPQGWRIRPVICIGSDLAGPARRFLERLPGLDLETGIALTDRPNNRVHLLYRDRQHRSEHLTGGVPPWSWEELAPRLEGLDALFINLISGFELDLSVARQIRGVVSGLLYADLHSLLLGIDDDGARRPRRLRDRGAWLSCFDVVQVNEDELALVAGDGIGPDVAADAVRDGLGAFLVTRGPEGATWFARGERPADRHGDVTARHLPAQAGGPTLDPTGCGDVWGATCFLRLAQGETLEQAVAAANTTAALNTNHRGADGLYDYLEAHR